MGKVRYRQPEDGQGWRRRVSKTPDARRAKNAREHAARQAEKEAQSAIAEWSLAMKVEYLQDCIKAHPRSRGGSYAYTIRSVRQAVVYGLGLDVKDAVILSHLYWRFHKRAIVDQVAPSWSWPEEDGTEREYFWVVPKRIRLELDTLRITKDRAVNERLAKYVKLGLLYRRREEICYDAEQPRQLGEPRAGGQWFYRFEPELLALLVRPPRSDEPEGA